MTLTDDEATRLLDRLADGVADRPIPINDLVAGARRRASRRRRTAVVGVVAGVVLVGTGGVVAQQLVDTSDSRPDVVAPSTADEPVPPPGTRYVGRGRVVVAVPREWETFTQVVCARPQSDYVWFEQTMNFGYRCPFILGPRTPPSGITIGSASYARHPGTERSVIQDGAHEVEVVGGGVGCRLSKPPQCSAAVRVPSVDASFAIETYTEDGPRLLADIVASIRVLPTGWTTVPYVETQDQMVPQVRDVVRELEALGLNVVVDEIDDPNLSNGVVASTPAAGEVVAEGGTVTLQVATGRN